MRSRLAQLALSALGAAFAWFAAGCTTPAPTAASPAEAAAAIPPLHLLDYAGDQGALEALDRDLTAAGSDAKKIAALEARLVEVLRRRDATPAARQAACQRLGLLLATGPARTIDAAVLASLSPLLATDLESDLARLALEPVPGAAVDEAFLAALAQSSGRTRIGLIQSIGRRRIASAVPALGTLLNQPDSAAAAAAALGQIGDRAALAALQNAKDATVAPVVAAKLSLARQLPAAEAAAVYRGVQGDSLIPAHQRAAALRGLIDAEPAAAASRIAEALVGADWTIKQAAIESIAFHPAAGLVPSLAAGLPSWDAPTQTAVLTAFGRRGDAAAIPALTKAAKHAEPAVRAAALTALGRVPGNPELVALLADVASGNDTDDAKLARQSLARLNGPGVSAAVLAAAGNGATARRVACIEQIALRNLTEGITLLRQSRLDPSAEVRAAAVGALGEIGTAADQRLVLDWAVAATAAEEQTRALRALVSVTLRDPNAADRARPVCAAIEQAPRDVCLRLLPALARFEDTTSADCALRLALREDAAIAEAATATLARWPGRASLPYLASVAEKAPVASARAAAVQAALRYSERNFERWSPELTEVLGKLLGASREPDTRRRLALLLPRANDRGALALAASLQSDPALASVARDAEQAIKASLAGPPTLRASGSGGQLKNVLDGNTNSRWSVPTQGGEWLEIDFRLPRPLRRLTLDQAGRNDDFPERYEVFVTDNPQEPGAVRVSGTGQRGKTVIGLPEGTRGRYVIIRNTAPRADSSWSISELWVE